ncbi:shikimate dehydrogenase (NADP(+)) [Litorimonas cladophorae]|uniref:Shikimate dehydrogenase (NADP(+)) n=1 Tax=Litorimonas cladophorae TaxID=1220491 RepID=A0A918NFT2_9PROT|nr:shikimate dehydrogenase [Litorimonas cladophorae]GGX67263.1 shikimate dehydrogenase (NADP(+)) [Litorimonas cladophorae]
MKPAAERPIPKLAGVCGWPIHHSLSPLLHSWWLKHLALPGAYVPFAVDPKTAVAAFRSLKQTSIVGVNVTLPLKTAAFESADIATEDAQKLGVANCLYKSRGQLVAHNTDLEGFAAPLIAKIGVDRLQSGSVLVIGAGGASRAVLGALLSLGVPEICLVNRTDAKAESLVDQVNVPSLYALPWSRRQEAAARADLIINASAAGMSGKPALDLSLEDCRDSALIYDLIYTPRVTPLMKAAQARGLDTLGGLEMLIAQARPSFKLFYGVAPPTDIDPTDMLFAALKSGKR